MILGGRVRPPESWCRCPDGPVAWTERERQAAHTTAATDLTEYMLSMFGSGHSIDQIAKIKYVFGKPIEESFEVEGPELETR